MEIGISRITLISAKSHTWSQVDLYHVLYLPEINDWPLHSGKTVSISAKMQFHAWVTNSGSPLVVNQKSLKRGHHAHSLTSEHGTVERHLPGKAHSCLFSPY